MTSEFSSDLIKKPFFVALVIILASIPFIEGCDKGGQKLPTLQQAVKKYDKATLLEGIITDSKGPVKTGTIKVTDSQGRSVAGTVLHNSEHYRVEIPAGTVLPIVLTYFPEATQTGGEEYMTAVVHPNVTQYDINSLSTAIAKKAKAMGGYTHSNLVVAAEKTGTVPDDNKMTAGFRGDPTKQYGGWH